MSDQKSENNNQNAPPKADDSKLASSPTASVTSSPASPPASGPGTPTPPAGNADASTPMSPALAAAMASLKGTKFGDAQAQEQALLASANNLNEDGVISEQVQIIFLQGYNATVGKLKTQFESDPSLKVYDNVPSKTVPPMARKLLPCMIVSSITKNEEIVNILTTLQVLRQEVKRKQIKFIVLSNLKTPSIINKFAEFGCQEYIVEPITDKVLNFKMALHLKALRAQRKTLNQQQSKKEATQKKLSSDATLTDDPNQPQNINAKLKEEAPVGGEADVWVFKDKKPQKKGGKWTLRMEGPDPTEGEWAEIGKDEEGNPKWRFDEKNKDPNKKGGGWEWSGEKPSFNNGEWNFEGKKPKLALIDENGKEKGSKVNTDGADGLILAKDSEEALAKATKREEQTKAKKDAKKKGLFAGSGETDDELFDDDTEDKSAEGTSKKKKEKKEDSIDFASFDDEDEELQDETKEDDSTQPSGSKKKTKSKKSDDDDDEFDNLPSEDDSKSSSEKELTATEDKESKTKKDADPKTKSTAVDPKPLKSIQKKDEDEDDDFDLEKILEAENAAKPEAEKKDSSQPAEGKKLANTQKGPKAEDDSDDITSDEIDFGSIEEQDPEFNNKLDPNKKDPKKRGLNELADMAMDLDEDLEDLDELENNEKDSSGKFGKRKSGAKEKKGKSKASEIEAEEDSKNGKEEDSIDFGSFGEFEEVVETPAPQNAVKKPKKSDDIVSDEDDDSQINLMPEDDLPSEGSVPEQLTKGKGGDSKHGWSGHDTEEEVEGEAEEDKLIMIDAPKSSFRANKKDKEEAKTENDESDLEPLAEESPADERKKLKDDEAQSASKSSDELEDLIDEQDKETPKATKSDSEKNSKKNTDTNQNSDDELDTDDLDSDLEQLKEMSDPATLTYESKNKADSSKDALSDDNLEEGSDTAAENKNEFTGLQETLTNQKDAIAEIEVRPQNSPQSGIGMAILLSECITQTQGNSIEVLKLFLPHLSNALKNPNMAVLAIQEVSNSSEIIFSTETAPTTELTKIQEAMKTKSPQYEMNGKGSMYFMIGSASGVTAVLVVEGAIFKISLKETIQFISTVARCLRPLTLEILELRNKVISIDSNNGSNTPPPLPFPDSSSSQTGS